MFKVSTENYSWSDFNSEQMYQMSSYKILKFYQVCMLPKKEIETLMATGNIQKLEKREHVVNMFNMWASILSGCFE